MLREVNSLGGARGMASAWGDRDKYSLVSSCERAPEALATCGETIRRLLEVRIPGRIPKPRRALRSHTSHFRCTCARFVPRMRLLNVGVGPVLLCSVGIAALSEGCCSGARSWERRSPYSKIDSAFCVVTRLLSEGNTRRTTNAEGKLFYHYDPNAPPKKASASHTHARAC